MEEDYWLVLHEGTPLESAAQVRPNPLRSSFFPPRLTQRAVEGLQKELRRRATVRLPKDDEHLDETKGWCHFDSCSIWV